MTDKLHPSTPTRPVRPKYQVFVSSTFVDLREERQAVTWELLKAGHIPVGMENFSAYDDRGWKVINRTLESSDYYVLVLAGRYGSIDEGIGMSWTEREYRRAIELGVPVLAFIREKKYVPGDQVDTDDKARRLTELIAHVSNNRLRETWTTADDLRAKVALALLKAISEDEADGAPRPGWYRGNQLPSPASLDELARLSAENRALRDEVAAVQKRADAAVIPYISQPTSQGDMDGMITIFCEVNNHGETSFRIIEAEATWWFMGQSDAVRPAKVKIQPRFAKSGERCSVFVLLPLTKPERGEYQARLQRDLRTSPVEAELTVTCESTAGVRKVAQRVVQKYVGQLVWQG